MLVIVIHQLHVPQVPSLTEPPKSPCGSHSGGTDSIIQEGIVRLWGRVSFLFRFSQVLPEEARTREQLLKHP